jgi:transposase
MAKRTTKTSAANTVRNIRRKSRKRYSGEEKIRIVLEGLRGEETVAELCRREGISESVYYRWSKEFLEAGKQRLVGDTKRQATSRTPPATTASDVRARWGWPMIKAAVVARIGVINGAMIIAPMTVAVESLRTPKVAMIVERKRSTTKRTRYACRRSLSKNSLFSSSGKLSVVKLLSFKIARKPSIQDTSSND